jgi:hypothetical protein
MNALEQVRPAMFGLVINIGAPWSWAFELSDDQGPLNVTGWSWQLALEMTLLDGSRAVWVLTTTPGTRGQIVVTQNAQATTVVASVPRTQTALLAPFTGARFQLDVTPLGGQEERWVQGPLEALEGLVLDA